MAADDGAVAEPRFEALQQGWVSITRPWHLLTTNAGVGYPHAATAEKGRRMMDLLVAASGHVSGRAVRLAARRKVSVPEVARLTRAA